MKKLLGILVLGLLLTSCSEHKIKKALENCADKKWFAQYERGLFFKEDEIKEFKNHQVYIDAKKAQDKAASQRWKLKKELTKFKRNYEANNPKPKMPESVASQEEGLEALDKLTRDTHKWMGKRDRQIARKEMTIKMLKDEEMQAFKNTLKVKAHYADKLYKRMNIKKKSKLTFFVDLYGKCEEEYQKLPNKFLVEYSK